MHDTAEGIDLMFNSVLDKIFWFRRNRTMVIVKRVVLLCLLIMPTAVGAFQNEPNGYRDIHWGTNIEKIQRERKVEFLSQFPNPNIKEYSITLNDKENRGMYGFPMGLSSILCKLPWIRNPLCIIS